MSAVVSISFDQGYIIEVDQNKKFYKYSYRLPTHLACQCDYFYSTGHCEEETGNCECRAAFQPPNCDSCAYGYYGYPNCRECECNLNGTNGYHCEAESGQRCPCKINFAGDYCKQCAEGYYGFPECKACECNKIGSMGNDQRLCRWRAERFPYSS